MAGLDPLSFMPLHKGAGERSGETVQKWIRSWWSKDGSPILDFPLVEVTKDNMFELHKMEGARLWVPPPIV